jgi:hypothetical protein
LKGPLSEGAGGLQMVDFDFDGYGCNAFAGSSTREVHERDNDLALRVAQAMDLPSVRSPILCEGGNLHFNGQGLVLAVAGRSDLPGVAMLGRNPERPKPNWSRRSCGYPWDRSVPHRHEDLGAFPREFGDRCHGLLTFVRIQVHPNRGGKN